MRASAESRRAHPGGSAPSLLLLAAGVGSRFGGLKQLEPVGPKGQAILDYTVIDALEAGFGRVALIVRPETEARVRDHLRGIGRRAGRAEDKLLDAIDLVPQSGGPAGPNWGTGYAVLAAAHLVTGPFAVANADDFYGIGSLARLGAHLTDPARSGEWAMVAFGLDRTLSPHGGVSRGICTPTPRGFLGSVREASGIERHEGGIIRDSAGTPLPEDAPVSMNLWGFGPEVFELLAELAERHEAGLREPGDEHPGGSTELRLPDAVGEAIQRGTARVRMLRTEERWVGLTHPGDVEETRRFIKELHERGLYGS